MGLLGGGADRDTEGLYVSSDLWIMIISGQKGWGVKLCLLKKT